MSSTGQTEEEGMSDERTRITVGHVTWTKERYGWDDGRALIATVDWPAMLDRIVALESERDALRARVAEYDALAKRAYKIASTCMEWADDLADLAQLCVNLAALAPADDTEAPAK